MLHTFQVITVEVITDADGRQSYRLTDLLEFESTNPNPAAYELIQALFCPPTYPAPASTDERTEERHEAPAVMPTNWGKA